MCTSRGKKKLAGGAGQKKNTPMFDGVKKNNAELPWGKKKMAFGENRGVSEKKNYRQVASGEKKTGFIRGGEKKTTPC